VDGLLELICSSSQFIDQLFEEEIGIMLEDGNVNVAQLVALTRARSLFQNVATCMQYVLTI
jgi:hypothetical protein